MTNEERVVLPDHVRPLKYQLTLAPDLELFTFSGEETIDLEISQPTSEIALNAVDLQVQAASVTNENGATVSAQRISHDEDTETVTLSFGATLPTGQTQLALRFTGELNDRLHGFYRSFYQTPDGQTRTLASTQFEATDARRAFPCWDEPAVKASFDVTLIVPSHLTAVSNTMPVSETPEGQDKKRVRFRETPPMSTYLLAFVVGDLESIEGRSDDGTLIRIWTTPGRAEHGQVALDVAKRLLTYYNDYFGIPYPLEKLDHLAIPDFAAGAMENWGAITYREVALLFDPQNSTPATRQRIAEIVAHEMAHMWFGDLVTMEWWNDLWLNESFASWMATKAVDHLFPEWDMWTQFIGMDVNRGLALDGLENSHPIEQEVHNPAEISELFDAISYSKGASIIRMLEQYLGPDQFQRGLQRYLSAHTYGNARTQDLWQAMEEESGQPVTAMMNSWIAQVGYPVLQSEVVREGDETTVRLAQQRFLYTGPNQDPTLWQVPIRAVGQGADHADSMMLEGKDGTLRLQAARSGRSAWIKVNPEHTGFYRVQYTQEELARLIPAVETQELPAADRLGLQDDTYALARAGLVSATQFLELARAYRNEREYGVWADLSTNIRGMDHLITQEPFYPQFQAFVRELVRPAAQAAGWEPKPGEGHLQVLLRSTVLSQMGALDDSDTLQEAQSRFLRYLEEPSSLIPDLKGVVYGMAAQAGDENTHETLRRLARDTDFQEEKVRLHMALSRFTQPDLLEKTLEMSLSDEVRSQDTVGLVSVVAGNNHGGTELAWEFIKDNWAELDRRYGEGGFAMMRLVSVAGGFTTPEARQEVEEFFQSHPTPAATRTIQQSLERIDLNVRWLERNREDMAAWFGG